MKNKNSGGLQLIILIVVLGFGIKLCTNKKENTNTYTPSNFVDTSYTVKDTTSNNTPTVTALKKDKKNKKKKNGKSAEGTTNKSYSASGQTTKRSTSYSSSSSRGCSSRQCYGTTKKGSRCRNMTTSCNGYCWRHGG